MLGFHNECGQKWYRKSSWWATYANYKRRPKFRVLREMSRFEDRGRVYWKPSRLVGWAFGPIMFTFR